MNKAREPRTPEVTRRLILLFLVAALLRVTWVGARYGREGAWNRLAYPDEEAYVLSARSLAGGGGLIDEFGFRATYMPGYPAFLALFISHDQGLLLARVVQALLAASVAPATCLLAGAFLRVGCRGGDTGVHQECEGLAASATRPHIEPLAGASGSVQAPLKTYVPLMAGALAAMDPFLVFFSGLLLTEALYAAVLVSGWALVMRLADRGRALRAATVIGAGLLLYGAVMLRPAAMVLVIAAVCALPIVRRFDRAGWIATIGVLGVVMLGLLPWAMRNRETVGQWRWLTTRGGISLYDGVQEGASGGSNLAHTKVVAQVRGLSETQWDAYWNRRAWTAIREEPGRILRLAGDKFLRTWSLRPNVAEYQSGMAAAVSALWMSIVLLAGLGGWWVCRRRVSGWLLLLLPVVLTTLMHMMFVGSVRYRVPVMPMVMVLAAACLSGGPARRERRGMPPSADQGPGRAFMTSE